VESYAKQCQYKRRSKFLAEVVEKIYLTPVQRKTMNAIMDQITEFDQRSFAADRQSLGDFGSSMATNSSRGLDQRPTATNFSWSDRDFDRPCAVSSPLNEW
jgi:hypothetical protein